MVSKKILRMGVEKTATQKTYKKNVCQYTLDITEETSDPHIYDKPIITTEEKPSVTKRWKKQNIPLKAPTMVKQKNTSTENLTANPQPQTDTTTISLPTLLPFKKHHLSETQQSILYWRGYVNFEEAIKKRKELHPNQLDRIITNPEELQMYFEKRKYGAQIKYKLKAK